jgi:hypothetical protein
VGEVRRPQQVVVAKGVDGDGRDRLVGVGDGVALPPEVLAGRQRQAVVLVGAVRVPLLVHPPQQPRHPGDVRLLEHDAQPGMLLEHAAEDQLGHRRLRVEGQAHGHAHDLGPAVAVIAVPDVVGDLAQAGQVQRQRHVEPLELRPQRLELGVGQDRPVDAGRRHRHPHRTELLDAAAGLGGGEVGRLAWHPRPRLEPVAVERRELGGVVVVGPAEGGGVLGGDAVDGEQLQVERRREDGHVDAVDVHALEPRRRRRRLAEPGELRRQGPPAVPLAEHEPALPVRHREAGTVEVDAEVAGVEVPARRRRDVRP